jgi:hypothetical protein
MHVQKGYTVIIVSTYSHLLASFKNLLNSVLGLLDLPCILYPNIVTVSIEEMACLR